jgi:hypothetical protein
MTSYQDGIDLTELDTGPSQVWGAVRLVPLLRRTPITDLRLHPRALGRSLSIVDLGDRTSYVSYIPHALVAAWTRDGSAAAAYGTQLRDPAEPADRAEPACIGVRYHRRMARREAKQRLRFMPLHLALEGYLALQFGGPPIAWQEWTRRAVRQGLSPRVECSYVGASIPGLDEALRVFEIHSGQCGVALYLADALAALFVVPHPDDYRVLHPTLLQDLYGEMLYQYAHHYPAVPTFAARFRDDRVDSLADLRGEVARTAAEWASFHAVMAGGLLDHRDYTFNRVYQMGRFTLSRFLPLFDPDGENHCGECIVDSSGRLAYLKTFRLSAAQTRRGYLLSQLAAHEWHLDDTAAALGTTRIGLTQRLDRAGFGHLLRPDILDACRNQARRRR